MRRRSVATVNVDVVNYYVHESVYGENKNVMSGRICGKEMYMYRAVDRK